MRRSIAFAATLPFAFVACAVPSAPPRAPAVPASPTASAPATPTASATVTPTPAAPAPTASETAAPTAAPPPPEKKACPDDMVLVDGDYCTELEATCLRSTYAAQNKKTICWQFQEPTRCVGKKEHKRFCVDKYEYPNRAGEKPIVMNDFPQAQALCAAQGKRVCTETEWTTACEGPSYKPYPYGYARDPKKCNGDREYKFPDLKRTHSRDVATSQEELARLYDAVPSGSQPDCVSDYGVADMPGNADELAASETFGKRSPYDNVTTGGPWLEGVRNQCRPKIYTHNEGFSYYYLSFRCCAEPDGAPTDPRAPKQIQRKEAWRGGKPPHQPPFPTPSAPAPGYPAAPAPQAKRR